MLGSVGADPYGAEILALLDASGVSTEHVAQLDTPTGTAHVVVEGSGSNSIIVIPAANGARQSLTDRQRQVIRASRFLLLQLEIPLPLVAEAAAFARENGVQVLLTPAPVQPLDAELLRNVDLMVLNEGEALQLADAPSVEDALDTLTGSVQALIVTRGERGCLYRGPGGSYDLEAFTVEAVDTTAAGDTFVGALSARLARGRDVATAIRWASAAAAISVQRWGATPSMPHAADVDAFLAASSAEPQLSGPGPSRTGRSALPARRSPSARVLHDLLFHLGTPLLRRKRRWPHVAVVEIRRVLESERRVPVAELPASLEEHHYFAVLICIGGHSVPGLRC